MKKPNELDCNPKVHRIYMRTKDLRCSICPPNKGENAKRTSKHGNKTPRYKTR